MRIIIYYILVVLIWGSTWYAIELQLGQVAPEWSVAYRFFLASVLLFAWCIIRRRNLTFPIKTHMSMALLGLLLFSGNYILVYTGTGYLTSGLVAVAFSVLTILNIINARIFLKIPFERTILLGALLGISGLVMIFWPEVDQMSLSDDTTIGLGICLAGTMLASLGNTVAASKRASSIPVDALTAWGMLYGSVATALVALAMGKEFLLDGRVSYWASLLYLSLIGSVIAFSLYLWLLKNIGVAQTAYTAVMIPIVALIISTLFEGYIWTSASVIGLAMVVFGNVVMIQRKRKKPVSIVEA